MSRKKVAQVGIGGRSGMFVNAVMGSYAHDYQMVGACDINMTRMRYNLDRHRKKYDYPEVPMYHSTDFDRMVAETRPDIVIVTTMDRTHHQYICRAMELGCDAISEKPMTIDEEKCQQIIDTIGRTGKNLRVTFNYRYSPLHTKTKQLLMEGAIGDVTSVHFEWLLDTKHGADYFRRWHRDKANSGGLLVHKATHHFDLMNWWLGSRPETVFALGNLAFYGRQNAEARGETRFYSRATGNPFAAKDPFALHLDQDEHLKGMYLDAEHEDGYQRDQSVFGYNINIEDNMNVLVRYANKVSMSYNLHAHAPWEGFRIMFNGTKGRIEIDNHENSYVSSSKEDINLAENRDKEKPALQTRPNIVLQRHWEKPQAVDFEKAGGGHGGGDVRMLDHIFKSAAEDPFGHAAGYVDGAYSILTGIAANKSIASGLPVRVSDLVRF